MSTHELTTFEMEEEVEMPLIEDEEIIEIERGLGFTDGFQFGCGFWTAAMVAILVSGLAFLILTFLLSFAGINLLG